MDRNLQFIAFSTSPEQGSRMAAQLNIPVIESDSTKTEYEQQKEQLMNQVKTLRNRGFPYNAIASQLKMDPRTIVTYMHKENPPMQGKNKHQSMLKPYRSKIKSAVKPGLISKEIYKDMGSMLLIARISLCS